MMGYTAPYYLSNVLVISRFSFIIQLGFLGVQKRF
jgi:hypothetical protein